MGGRWGGLLAGVVIVTEPPGKSGKPGKPVVPTVVAAPALVVESSADKTPLTPEQQAVISEATNPVADAPARATTTSAEDLVTAGQRKINLLWEWTQASLAIIVTGVTLYVAARMALSGDKNEAAFLLLSNAFFSVISVYLTRTNHTKTGGVKHGDQGR